MMMPTTHTAVCRWCVHHYKNSHNFRRPNLFLAARRSHRMDGGFFSFPSRFRLLIRSTPFCLCRSRARSLVIGCKRSPRRNRCTSGSWWWSDPPRAAAIVARRVLLRRPQQHARASLGPSDHHPTCDAGLIS
ncbi:hypothetical protein BS78_01G143900 [Paspalum vaginatum]|nr:hypothetical protein BS78_01G143900 [Paspalum vaginatum]